MKRYRIISFGLIFSIILSLLLYLGFSSIFLDTNSQNNKKNKKNQEELILSKSANKNSVQTDSSDNEVTFTINFTNNKQCQAPVDVVLAYDSSRSMDDGQLPPQPFTGAMEAGYAFIDNIDRFKDQVGLVSFNSNSRRNSPLTSDGRAVKELIEKIRIDSDTNILAGLQESERELNSVRSKDGSKKVVIIFSDGKANKPNPINKSSQKAIDYAQQMKNDDIEIIAIGLGVDSDPVTLSQIASEDQYYFAPNAQTMKVIYEDLARSFQGVSTSTVISDDVSKILQTGEITSISNNGSLVGNEIKWNLGNIPCGESEEVRFTARFDENYNGIDQIINIAEVENSSGDSTVSNEVRVNILSPDLIFDITDNKTFAEEGEQLDYVITVNNIGSGFATNVNLRSQMPDIINQLDSTISGNGISSKTNNVEWVFDLNAGDSTKFYVSAEVTNGLPPGYSNIIATAELVNNDRVLEDNDSTQVFIQDDNQPDFTTFVNCIEKDDTTNTFTAYYGYVNRKNDNQSLDVNRFHPDFINASLPNYLSEGRNDKSVIVENIPYGTNSVWITHAGQVKKTATASINSPECDNNVTPSDAPEPSNAPTVEPTDSGNATPTPSVITSPTPTPVPDSNPIDEFVGSAIVFESPTDNDQEPPFINVQQVNSSQICSTDQLEFSSRIIDNRSISSAQYSIDGGQNWYPLNSISNLGEELVEFNFQTRMLQDGRYEIVVRAIDNSFNIGLSEIIEINKNCEDLIIGTNHFKLTDLQSPISDKGTVLGVENYPLDISLKVYGGPDEVWIEDGNNGNRYELDYQRELDLWVGEIQPENPGQYSLTAYASDGENEISKTINNLVILPSGKILNQDSQRTTSQITLYYRSNQEDNWELWNGESLRQPNPTNGDDYAFIVENGEYYISAKAEGYREFKSNIISVDQTTILNDDIILENDLAIFNSVLSLFDDNQYQSEDFSEAVSFYDASYLLERQIIENISIEDSENSITKEGILDSNKPKLITFWNSWSTNSQEQLNEISKINSEDYEIYVIGIDRSQENINTYIRRGGYNITPYRISSLDQILDWRVITTPQNFFVDGNGVIQDITTGRVLDAEFIESKLNDLNKSKIETNE